MTPEEVAELSNFGLELYLDLVQNICTLILFGIYCLAFCIALYTYWWSYLQRSSAAGAKKIMICVLLGTFVLMLVLLVSGVVPISGLVKYGLVVTLPGGILEQTMAANTQPVYYDIMIWSSNII
ncbi:hypothetical protein BDP27DRAFT_608580 [Rhodocollybia butyracea]|uniref:Uncharacterized protein n=1 Tax=Rhodocollybia butyracea TaxID=206335 RepID=A0A9P5UGF3_9AGAR|nr:hypothetical protein BDP27DRAFT_608580 [Rhodocollybia butyracea]